MDPRTEYDRPVRIEWKLCAHLRVENPAITQGELGKRLGRNINTIIRWVNDPEYQRYEAFVLRKEISEIDPTYLERTLDVQKEFGERSPEMQERLYNLIQMVDDPKLEAELVQDWLDRAGHAPQRKVAGHGQTVVVITKEAAETFLQRAAEAELVDGEVLGVAALDVQTPPRQKTG